VKNDSQAVNAASFGKVSSVFASSSSVWRNRSHTSAIHLTAYVSRWNCRRAVREASGVVNIVITSYPLWNPL